MYMNEPNPWTAHRSTYLGMVDCGRPFLLDFLSALLEKDEATATAWLWVVSTAASVTAAAEEVVFSLPIKLSKLDL